MMRPMLKRLLLFRGRGLRSVTSTPSPTSLEAIFNGGPGLDNSAVSSSRAALLSPLRQQQQRREQTANDNAGLFTVPQLTCPEGFGELRRECAGRVADLVREACDDGGAAGGRRRLVAEVFDDMSDELCRVADLAEFVRVAHPDGAVRVAAEEACIGVSGLVEQLNTHTGLYNSLKNAVEKGDSFPETDVDRHVAKLFLLDFQQSGIHLDDEDRQMVVRLLDHALQLGQQFSAGAHRPCIASRSLVPDAIRKFFQFDGERVVLGGPQADSANDLVRETAHKLQHRPDPRQEAMLTELLSCRARIAGLCGYETFAHRALAESLGGSPENVHSFLIRLADGLRPSLEADLDRMRGMKRLHGNSGRELEVWDVPYFSAKAKANLCKVNDAVAEYFSLGTCMEGLNAIFRSLFGVELWAEAAAPGETWHHDVVKLAVRDVDGGGDLLLGHIYCDFFTRPGKPHQDCHFTIRGGRQLSDGSYQSPAVVLMLSLQPGSWGAPCLLGGPALDNLFHEMGHAMHSMLGRTKYQHVTGTRCSTDFAEVPSTMMEYLAADPGVLRRIGAHYRTREPLPEDLAERFCASKKVFCAADVHTQLFYSLVDQEFHSLSPSSAAPPSTSDVVERLHALHHPLPYHADVAWHHRFSHLTGYGARYYSYLMARAVAASFWRKLFSNNDNVNPLDNADAGRRYRRECLSHGGGKPSARIVSDLLGVGDVSADPSALADAVVGEVEAAASAVKGL